MQLAQVATFELEAGKKREGGSSGRTRTYNPPVNSRVLYH